MDCMTIYIGYGFFTFFKMNTFVKIGIFACFFYVSGVAVENEKGLINAVKVEPGLSVRDQFIVIGCVTGFTLGLLIALIIGCFLKFNSKSKNKSLSEKDYNSLDQSIPVDFPGGVQTGDRKLAKSAQMYHYQLTKQDLIEKERAESIYNEKERASDGSDTNDECTVYECPGLGKMQNMEIRNPLFDDSSSVLGGSEAPSKVENVVLSKQIE